MCTVRKNRPWRWLVRDADEVVVLLVVMQKRGHHAERSAMTDRDPFEVVRAALNGVVSTWPTREIYCRWCLARGDQDKGERHDADCLVPAAREALAEIRAEARRACQAEDPDVATTPNEAPHTSESHPSS